MTYTAIMNTPGYLPGGDDEPPVFDTAGEAWSYLADERRNQEEDTYDDTWNYSESHVAPYSETVDTLDAHASAGLGPDTVYGDTPGYDGSHDLGIAYTVTEVEADDDSGAKDYPLDNDDSTYY